MLKIFLIVILMCPYFVWAKVSNLECSANENILNGQLVKWIKSSPTDREVHYTGNCENLPLLDKWIFKGSVDLQTDKIQVFRFSKQQKNIYFIQVLDVNVSYKITDCAEAKATSPLSDYASTFTLQGEVFTYSLLEFKNAGVLSYCLPQKSGVVFKSK